MTSRVYRTPALELPAGRREWSLADDDHRQLGVRQHLLRLAAEQHRRHAAPAVRRHHDGVALVLLRRGEDRFPRRGGDRIRRLAFDARRLRLRRDAVEDLLARPRRRASRIPCATPARRRRRRRTRASGSRAPRRTPSAWRRRPARGRWRASPPCRRASSHPLRPAGSCTSPLLEWGYHVHFRLHLRSRVDRNQWPLRAIKRRARRD